MSLQSKLPLHSIDYSVARKKSRKIKSLFVAWVKELWKDIFTMAALAGAALGIFNAPLASTRTFPVTFTSSGEIIYPDLAYPHRGWILPTWLSAVVSILIPTATILLFQAVRIRSLRDASNAITGLIYALVLSTLSQVTIKALIGGFRPYFLAVCQPDTASFAASQNSSGLEATGYQNIFFTSEICTTDDKNLLKTAMTSFPSGHSAAAWAGFGYLFLYLNAKLKVFANYRPAMWKVALIFAPVLGAVLISCSLTIDQAHHWYDIVAGSAIGIAFALACYRMGFASVWDWRFNHVPLDPEEEFLYEHEASKARKMQMTTDKANEAKGRHAFVTQRAGWGRMAMEGGEVRADNVERPEGDSLPRGSVASGALVPGNMAELWLNHDSRTGPRFSPRPGAVKAFVDPPGR